ncbi:hypothetical protein NNA33_10900 [Marisediminitalea aggregata]|uniref:hypothetical protein n=1 Tax=Marisediminitalea aggregata TaxID=634436 RepID=UPI0020CDF497|nr:hypothetical protein [Marisediminitalea aggregata]MCP9478424.1 hypothetical protein [Marisediminitalea aggregata]
MATFYNKQHGEFSLIMNQDVVLTNAVGPWNLECIEQFGIDYATSVYTAKVSKWADIIMLQGESLLVPDAEKDLQVRIARAVETGLSHVAVVMCKSEVKTTAKLQMKRLYRNLPAELAFFDTLNEAIDWVKQQGYRCERKSVENFFEQSF